MRGLTCHDDALVYNGTRHTTFIGACRARGLLQDDEEWRACLTEAATWQGARSLRNLFATILCECQPSDPPGLWAEFKEDLCEDILHTHRVSYNDPERALDAAVENEALLDIQAYLETANTLKIKSTAAGLLVRIKTKKISSRSQ